MALENLILAFEVASFYGSIFFAIIIFVILWLKEDKKLLLLFVLDFAIISGIVYGLKFFIRAPRPNFTGELPFYETSFPSGHSARAFFYSVILSQRFRGLFQYLLYLLAILTAIGRIVTAEHFPIDVFVGSIIGFGVSWFSIKYQNKILKLSKIF
ncbi:TPA: phosphatase PAP2 family protein [archaeon]|uniref:Phosphatase PAP2 family protein n=1 Tax=Candidatus Naiadarchaeum limnaeum TaxID=2756139 RepID=A0A832V0E1_9ARCH|nr:phosphatase PAP2 family protein [Candidatus Naiadarchaeales archaeon SRR2090153.bin1042]HIJ99982.1 phosphatase PAP2 family protein [Candidatus Naiadarchaeum limnaeum]